MSTMVYIYRFTPPFILLFYSSIPTPDDFSTLNSIKQCNFDNIIEKLNMWPVC